MWFTVALSGELHAAVGPTGSAPGFDEECAPEKSHGIPSSQAGQARGLHPTGHREMGVHLWEIPAVQVQSECSACIMVL